VARFNFGYDDKLVGLGEPVQVVADSHCLNCRDEYNGRDLVRGKCFSCRLHHHYTRHSRLEVRASHDRLEFYPTAEKHEDITVERKEREV
jgi:hypothetical protein